MEININYIGNQFLINYLNFLINRVYKCLPMKENEEPTLSLHINSLLREIIGNQNLIVQLKNNANFVSLIGKLNYLAITKNIDLKTYRKDIFDCIALIEKIKEEVFSE